RPRLRALKSDFSFETEAPRLRHVPGRKARGIKVRFAELLKSFHPLEMCLKGGELVRFVHAQFTFRLEQPERSFSEDNSYRLAGLDHLLVFPDFCLGSLDAFLEELLQSIVDFGLPLRTVQQYFSVETEVPCLQHVLSRKAPGVESGFECLLDFFHP